MLRLLSSVSALAFVSGAALAADLPPIETPPPPPMTSPIPLAYNWSGFYFGGHGGWGFNDDDGPVLGGHIGVNWQWNTFVLGAEGDVSWVDVGDADLLASARLRGGFAIDQLLIYGTGGAAFGDFDEVGWVAGAGAEFQLTPNFTHGAEYLHYDLDDEEADVIRGRASIMFSALAGM
jgi:outer membrane immunogenic protein